MTPGRPRTHVNEARFRELADRMPFYRIAAELGLELYTVRRIAKRLGIVPKFVATPEQPGERDTILRMFGEGVGVCAIAEHMGRSQDFVSQRVKVAPPTAPRPVQDRHFPKPYADPATAMRGVAYEDVARPEPRGTPVLAMRAASLPMSLLGCAAAMCEGSI